MKTIIFIAVLLLCILGCTSQQTEQLTEQQIEQIKKEVRVFTDNVLKAWESLDLDKTLSYYSQDMVKVGDNTLQDFQAYKNAGIDFLNIINSMKFTEDRWECIVLSKNLVLSYWSGKAEFQNKSGEIFINDPNIYTNLNKKENGQWKVIYEQSFGIPVTQKEDQK